MKRKPVLIIALLFAAALSALATCKIHHIKFWLTKSQWSSVAIPVNTITRQEVDPKDWTTVQIGGCSMSLPGSLLSEIQVRPDRPDTLVFGREDGLRVIVALPKPHADDHRAYIEATDWYSPRQPHREIPLTLAMIEASPSEFRWSLSGDDLHVLTKLLECRQVFVGLVEIRTRLEEQWEAYIEVYPTMATMIWTTCNGDTSGALIFAGVSNDEDRRAIEHIAATFSPGPAFESPAEREAAVNRFLDMLAPP
jgi:hypothetical protein